MKLTILAFFSCISVVFTSPNGAPTLACDTLIPLHPGTTPQTSTPPFTIFAGSATGRTFNIQILSSIPFRGFLIQPRLLDSNPIVSPGTFQFSSTSQTINCHGGSSNTATHIDNSPRTNQTVLWNVPVGFTGHVRFQ